MRKIVLLLISVMMVFVGNNFAQTGSIAQANLQQESYFPDNIFDKKPETNDFMSRWYGKNLKALKEPSIYEERNKKDKQVFRFLWLRTFHNPISIRLEINRNDGSGILYVKMTDGAGGYEPGKIKEDFKKSIAKDKIAEFLELLKRDNFWQLTTKENPSGLDGARWIIEGLQDGKYYLVDRWSPKTGGIRDIGLFLLDLSGLKVEDIY